MPDSRHLFRRNINQVVADGQRTSHALVNRLKRMKPQEFLRQPLSMFANLTASQYRDVVATIAPEVRLPAAPEVEVPQGEDRKLRDWWRERSVFLRSVFAMLIVTVTCSFAGALAPWVAGAILSRMEIVRPIATDTWPVCRRLSRYTDGCVYAPSQDLNWDWAARQLGIPSETLWGSNRHLPREYIPRGTQLVVWRHRGRLVEK